MRRFVGQLRPGYDGGGSSLTAQDNSLGLSHLRKLFGELKQPSPGSTQNELENKLYNMLPLFCKVIFCLCINISVYVVYVCLYYSVYILILFCLEIGVITQVPNTLSGDNKINNNYNYLCLYCQNIYFGVCLTAFERFLRFAILNSWVHIFHFLQFE